MSNRNDQFSQLKHQIETIRRTRESLCPYPPTLKRAILEHAINEMQELGVLDDISEKVGLEWGLLLGWFREGLPAGKEENGHSDE